jgi:Carboxypeptidase regulatory-like domain
MRNLLAKLALLAIFLSFPFALKAQDSASMTGVVTDATGAIIPDTTVTLTNALTGASYTQTTDSKGVYHFLNVPPKEGYKLSFSHNGFSVAEVANITLSVGTPRTQDAKLLAGTHTAIEVSADNQEVTINTTNASIGNNIDVEQLNNLPVQNRNTGITTLFSLQPGVSPGGAVTGARTDQTEVTVDGLDVNDQAAGTAFAIIGTAPIDSVQEFTGTVAGLTSAIGTGAGGQFQLVTKNGTNKFHGNINEYHRDTTTQANLWFSNNNGIRRTPLIQNQFGGNFGGPVWIPKVYNGRDKLFFFVDIGDSRIIQSTLVSTTVPLDSYRAGTINYINNGATCNDSSRLNTTPTCISNLSSAQIATLDPAGIGFNPNVLAFINARYPHANDLTLGDGVNTGGFRFTTATPNIDSGYVARVDYSLSSKQRVFGRVTLNRQNQIQASGVPQFPTDPVTHPTIDRSYGYVISHVWTIGENKVNQIYFGNNVSKLSFPDLYNPTGANQYALTGLSGPYTAFNGQQRRVPIPVIRDDFNWQVGSHSIGFGANFKFIKTNSNLINNFNFVGAGLAGTAIGSGFGVAHTATSAPNVGTRVRPADINAGGSGNVSHNDYDRAFALGLGVIGDISTNFNFNNAGVAQPAGSGGPRAYRFFETEAYIGDTWKVNKELTISYGLRYQTYSVPYEAHGNESVETPFSIDDFVHARQTQASNGVTGNSALPLYQVTLGGKANKGPNLYQQTYLDLAPRVAFAYNPSFARKTVINGSAGIVYDRTVINAINFLQDQISYLFSNNATRQFGSAKSATLNAVDNSLLNDPRLGANLAYSSSLNPAPTPIAHPLTPFIDGSGVPFGQAEGDTNFVIDPHLKDPYSIALNFGIQQEIPGHMVLRVNYVSRLGRRLLADADAGQVLEFPSGGQSLSSAFGSLTTQLRAGKDPESVTGLTAQPWFETIMPSNLGTTNGYANNTSLVADIVGQQGNNGDIADMLNSLAFVGYYDGFPTVPSNVGVMAQFGSNAYLTNKGNSNYHGLLTSLTKNTSHGLRFDVNYTWSHSIDNTSLTSNGNALFSNTGFICDVTNMRACRGSSDFDIRHSINSNFTYALPVGHGKTFMGSSPRWVDEAIGGWSVSGIPSFRTGTALTSYSAAFLASFDNTDPAIFIGTNKGDLKLHPQKVGATVYGFAGGVAGAQKVLAEFRGPIGLEYGQRNLLRGVNLVAFDAGLGKTFPILADNKLNLQFRADAFNVLNHPIFGNPSLAIVGNSNYGKITGMSNSPRVAQFSLRLEF